MSITANRQKPYFDRKTTNIIKGIALIMMSILHFFTFPDWWGEGISYPLIEKAADYLRSPLKLCVPVFCFLTGYFYFFNTDHSYKYSFRKISDIYISYWCIFFPFALIAVLFADYTYTFSGFVKELLAIETPAMCFCWYVNYYCFTMLTLPLLAERVFSKNIHFDLIVGLILIPSIFRLVSHFIPIGSEFTFNLFWWSPVVYIGYIFANYGLFEKMESLLRKIGSRDFQSIILIFCFFLAPAGRLLAFELTLQISHLPDFIVNMDIFYAPVFIFVLVHFCKTAYLSGLKAVLSRIGKYSLLMWFISCIFYGNSSSIFQPILYLPHNPVLVTLWGNLLCYVFSYVADIGIKRIQNYKNAKCFPDQKQ